MRRPLRQLRREADETPPENFGIDEPGNELPDMLERVGRRLSDVDRAVDGVAVEVRRDLDEYASRQAPEPRTAGKEMIALELLEALTRRTAGLKREVEELSAILERAASHLSRDAGLPGVDAGPDEEPIEQALRTPPSEPAPPEVLDSVRLLATQMAAAGSSRAEIERRLLSEYGMRDAHEVLAEVLDG